MKIKHRTLESCQKKRTQVSHFCFLHLNQRYGHEKLLSFCLAMEVTKCSVSQGDELGKSQLAGTSKGLWFNLLLKAITSPAPDQLSHGFGQISKTTSSAPLDIYPGSAPPTSRRRGAQPKPPKVQFVAGVSCHNIWHNQEEFGPIISVTARGAVAGCYRFPSTLPWNSRSQLPLSLSACQGTGKTMCTASLRFGPYSGEQGFETKGSCSKNPSLPPPV